MTQSDDEALPGDSPATDRVDRFLEWFDSAHRPARIDTSLVTQTVDPEADHAENERIGRLLERKNVLLDMYPSGGSPYSMEL